MRFSVIVPTYNRPQPLADCLGALARLDYPREQFEVIVVDDGGGTLANAITAGYADRLAVRWLRQAHAGPGIARNLGAGQARGEYLAFTDDDCAPCPDWLSALENRFARAPECLVGGATINGKPANLYASASQLLIDYLYACFFPVGSAPKASAFATSNNMSLPIDRFRALGGFQPVLPSASAEDRDLCYRWQRAGYALCYAPEVRVVHQQQLTLSSFLRQHYTYGRGAYLHRRRQSAAERRSLRVEPLAFYTNLIRYPLAIHARKSWRLAGLLLLAQLANVAGFARERLFGRQQS
jgi:glycosyltransferase involved in cell wall biosynthesis